MTREPPADPVHSRNVGAWLRRTAVALAVAGICATAVLANTSHASTPPVLTPAQPPGPVDPLAQHGRALYSTRCSTCHGVDGAGTTQGPDIRRSGAAAADFQLRTGRMPADRGGKRGTSFTRNDPAYNDADIKALVAYVASLDHGPPIPQVDLTHANLSNGQALFSVNCAPCHSAAGAGGALGPQATAPSLHRASAVEVVEAIRTGPGAMPVFGPDTITPTQARDIARYVQYLRHPVDRGGLSLGRVGPIPEGFVAWIIGLGLLLIVSRWIGARE